MQLHQPLTIPDLIRRVALHNLIGYPDGIQTVQLRKLVEDSLNDYLPVSNSKNATRYKNSLWDLEKRFPAYVEKHVIAHKNVLLKPTHTLFEEIDQIPLPDFRSFFEHQFDLNYLLETADSEPSDYISSMRELIYNISDLISQSEFYAMRQRGKVAEGVYDMSKYLEGASPKDMMIYVHLTGIISIVEKVIDELFDED